MLFKVFMGATHTDWTDRVGFIEAQDVTTALDRLAQTLTNSWFDSEVPPMPRTVRADGKQGQLTIKTTEDGIEGEDIYMVQALGSDIALFLMEDWRLFFELDEVA